MTRAGVGIAVAAFLFSGCGIGSVTTGETRHETASIDLDKSAMARVSIRMGAGELTVKSGTPKLMDATFTYNVPEWKPVVDYKPGELTISQPSSGSRFGNTEYKWDLKLNEQLPLEVVANLGAGEATLELGAMNLRSLDVNLGAGELKLDLRGEPTRDYNVRIQGGVGEATVQLPRDVAIAATATGGLGEISTSGLEQRGGVWINPDRIGASVTVRVDVKGGIGSIRLVRQ